MNFKKTEAFIKDVIELQKKHNLTVIFNYNANIELHKLCNGITMFFTDDVSPIKNNLGIKSKSSKSGRVITIINKFKND